MTDGIVQCKVPEFVQADFLGMGGEVNVGEDISAGKIDIRPVEESGA